MRQWVIAESWQRSAVVAAGFAAAVVELSGLAPALAVELPGQALEAIEAAFDIVRRRGGPALAGM